MRIPLLLAAFVAILSFGNIRTIRESASPVGRRLHWQAHGRISQIFTSQGSERMNIEGRGEVECKTFTSFPYTYLVCEKETLRSIKWDRIEYCWTDPSDRYYDFAVFNSSSVTGLFGMERPTDHREFILFEFTEHSDEVLSSARIHSLQLDDDEEREYIVQGYVWPKHIYFIYDLRDGEWQLIKQIGVHDKSASFPEINTRIAGHFGLREIYYSMDLGNEHYNYFRLEGDSVAEKFTITTSDHNGSYTSSGPYHFQIKAECELTYNTKSVQLDYTITLYCSKQPFETGKVFDVSYHSYNLIRDKNGNMISDQDMAYALPFGEEHDAHFYTVDYGYHRLMHLKSYGTAFQKNVLKDFQYLQ